MQPAWPASVRVRALVRARLFPIRSLNLALLCEWCPGWDSNPHIFTDHRF